MRARVADAAAAAGRGPREVGGHCGGHGGGAHQGGVRPDRAAEALLRRPVLDSFLFFLFFLSSAFSSAAVAFRARRGGETGPDRTTNKYDGINLLYEVCAVYWNFLLKPVIYKAGRH